MIAAPLARKHRRQSGLFPLECVASNEQESRGFRGVGRGRLSRLTLVEAIVDVGMKAGDGLE
jgi:hypothetical protein